MGSLSNALAYGVNDSDPDKPRRNYGDHVSAYCLTPPTNFKFRSQAKGRKLDMHGFITPDAMSKRDEDSMQECVLSIYRLTRVTRFAAIKHASTSADRLAGRFTATGGRRNFDNGIFSDSLRFPSRIKSTHEGTVTVNSNIHRRIDKW